MRANRTPHAAATRRVLVQGAGSGVSEFHLVKLPRPPDVRWGNLDVVFSEVVEYEVGVLSLRLRRLYSMTLVTDTQVKGQL